MPKIELTSDVQREVFNSWLSTKVGREKAVLFEATPENYKKHTSLEFWMVDDEPFVILKDAYKDVVAGAFFSERAQDDLQKAGVIFEKGKTPSTSEGGHTTAKWIP